MKVRETSGKSSGALNITGREGKKVSGTNEGSFQKLVTQVEEKSLDQRVNELVGQIAEQGEKLSQRIDISELRAYKKLITEFLDVAVGNSRKFSKKSCLDRRGRYKVYATIKRINEELDLLTEDVLKNEKDHIKILQRLGDIKGLILDMLM